MTAMKSTTALSMVRVWKAFQYSEQGIRSAWRDEAAKTAAWDAFMRDPEWAEIKRRTAAEHGALEARRVAGPHPGHPAAQERHARHATVSPRRREPA